MQGGATDGGDSEEPLQHVRTHNPYSDQYPKFEEVPLDVPQSNSAHPFSYSPTVASRRSVHGAPFQPRSFVPYTERLQAAMMEPGRMPRGYETPWVPTGDAAQRASGMAFESGRHRGGQSNRLVEMERNFRMSRIRTQTYAVSGLRLRFGHQNAPQHSSRSTKLHSPCQIAADQSLNQPRCRAQGPLFALDGATGQWKKRHFRVTDGVISYTQVFSTMSRVKFLSSTLCPIF